MSLSLETPVNITYSTAQDISDEILGGTIQFCRDNGYNQDIEMLAFFWSAFFCMLKNQLEEYDLTEEVANCYVNSLKKVVLELSDDESMREKAEDTSKRYRCVIASYLVTVEVEEKIPSLFEIIDDKRSQVDIVDSNIHKVATQKSFKQVLNVIESNIYNILRQIKSEFGIQYKGILDEVFYAKYKQKTNINSQNDKEKKVSSATVIDMNRMGEEKLGMSWYNFLTRFALVAGAVFNFVYSIGYMTGEIYTIQTNGEITASQVYLHYGRIVQFIDIVYGIFLIVLGVMAIILRDKLVKYKSDAVKYVIIYYWLVVGIPFIYAANIAIITEQDITADAVTAVILGIGLLVFNIKYFNKRKHLFTGDNVVKNEKSFSQTSKHCSKVVNTSTSRIMFCRKCGIRLVDDSEFCHKCGTRIVN